MSEEKKVIVKKKWRAVRNSWGYKGRYWAEGQEIVLDSDDKPNKHFELIGTYVENPKDAEIVDLSKAEVRAMSQMPHDLVPTGGMGGSLPAEMKRSIGVTASQALKDKK